MSLLTRTTVVIILEAPLPKINDSPNDECSWQLVAGEKSRGIQLPLPSLGQVVNIKVLGPAGAG